MKRKLAIASCAAVLFGAGIATAATTDEAPSYGKRVISPDAVAKSPRGSFDVYIDELTGFAYVNTLAGWKFTRRVDAEAPVVGKAAQGVPAKP